MQTNEFLLVLATMLCYVFVFYFITSQYPGENGVHRIFEILALALFLFGVSYVFGSLLLKLTGFLAIIFKKHIHLKTNKNINSPMQENRLVLFSKEKCSNPECPSKIPKYCVLDTFYFYCEKCKPKFVDAGSIIARVINPDEFKKKLDIALLSFEQEAKWAGCLPCDPDPFINSVFKYLFGD